MRPPDNEMKTKISLCSANPLALLWPCSNCLSNCLYPKYSKICADQERLLRHVQSMFALCELVSGLELCIFRRRGSIKWWRRRRTQRCPWVAPLSPQKSISRCCRKTKACGRCRWHWTSRSCHDFLAHRPSNKMSPQVLVAHNSWNISVRRKETRGSVYSNIT